MSTDEGNLIARAVQGDADALSELLELHGPLIESRLRIGRQWQDQLEPADIMQVTYLEAFLEIRRFDPARGVAFSTWLARIAANNLRDAVRGLQRQKRPQPRDRAAAVGNGDSVVGLYELLGTTSMTPSRQVGRGELSGLLAAAIARLPDDYSTVIRMYDLEDRPIDDVARTLGRSRGAVHMLRARAHERLRELLGAESFFFSRA